MITFRGHVQATAEGRGRERHRRIFLTAVAAIIAKVVSAGTALVSMPLTLHYLGAERYGLWMTTSSLVAALSFADFGIGNGMVGAIAVAHGRDDRRSIQECLSSAFLVLVAIAIALLILAACIYPLVPWPKVFNVHTALAQREAGQAVMVFFVCVALAIPAMIVQRVQMALQRGFLASLWQCAGSLLGLAGVLVAIALRAGLPWLVLAFLGAPLLAALLNGLLYFGRVEPDIAPSYRRASTATAALLAKSGGLFVALQVVATAPYATDNLLIAQFLGAPTVTQYAIPERMFGLITAVLTMALLPLWPAYGEAIARGDVGWVQHTLRRSLLLAVGLSSVGALSLALAGPWLVKAVVGASVAPTYTLLFGLAAWKVTEAYGNALSAFLNGARFLGAQVLLAVITATVAIAAKVLLLPRYGVEAAPWITSVTFATFTAIPAAVMLPAVLRSIGGRSPHAT